MRLHTVEVYNFSELSEAAQQKVVEKRQQINGELFDGAKYVYENTVTIAALFGLEIDKRQGRHTPTIYYSGFWCQGDGACYEGYYSYKKGALQAVKEFAPNDTELQRIVKALQDIQRRNFYRVTARTAHRGHYYHSGCMSVDTEYEDITQPLRDFADWIYKRLEDEYNYETSEENARECLMNDYTEYTAEGEEI